MHRLSPHLPRAAFVLAALISVGTRAQEIMLPDAPVSAPSSAAAPLIAPEEAFPAPGGWIQRAQAAERALQMGFSTVAEALLRELLNTPGIADAARDRLTLDLVAALLDRGRLDEAASALDRFNGAHTSAWHLRAGLLAANRRQIEPARAAAAQIQEEELPPAERGWRHFLDGLVADLAGDIDRRNRAYEEANKAAVSDLQRARFTLEQERARLLSTPANEQQASQLKVNVERFQGQKLGYEYTRVYAIVLDALGDKPAAVEQLRRQLSNLPQEEKQVADDLRLLLGLIAGPESGTGRSALFRLLDGAADHESQRVALRLLAGASSEGAFRAEFRAKLDQLIAAPTPHPILEHLLLFRAQLALAEENYENYQRADEDAKTLVERFPGSQLKAQALGVRTSVAWELRRFRTVADHASQLREALPPGDERRQISVLVADAYFRSEDFRSAAGAYSAAMRDPPAAVTPGVLLFQRVLAEINAEQRPGGDASFGAAQALLDEAASLPDTDAVNRWQAEWNLARALQARNQTLAALKRVERLTAEASAAKLPAELFVRMAWLQARLAFKAGSPAEAVRLVDALFARLESPAMAALPERLREEVASTSALLKVQALLAFDEPRRGGGAQEGLALLKKLRDDYPRSDAAAYSYIAEARYYSDRGEITEAGRLLTKLADDDKTRTNPYAPLALYSAALNAEKLGQEAGYGDAIRLIERLVKDYPQSELVFYARLKQGDLERQLNQFGEAQLVYDWLRNNFARHADVVRAEFGQAACHYAQAATDPAHWEKAELIYEGLVDRPAVPADMRVEAGYMLGHMLAQRGSNARAQEVWWRAVNTFLLDANRMQELGAKGPYWMSRILLELGELSEKEANLDQARRAYELLLQQKLPGEALAEQRLARFSSGGGQP